MSSLMVELRTCCGHHYTFLFHPFLSSLPTPTREAECQQLVSWESCNGHSLVKGLSEPWHQKLLINGTFHHEVFFCQPARRCSSDIKKSKKTRCGFVIIAACGVRDAGSCCCSLKKRLFSPCSPSHHSYSRKTWSCSAMEEHSCQKSAE